MISRWQFWLITAFVALATGVAYIVTWSPLSLWIGGGILFFWINGRIREEISDSYYINAAYTTLTACVLTVPQIFYGGTAGGLAMYIVTVGYQLLAFFTNIDYVSHRSVAAVGRNWRSNTKNTAPKRFLTITQSPRAIGPGSFWRPSPSLAAPSASSSFG